MNPSFLRFAALGTLTLLTTTSFVVADSSAPPSKIFGFFDAKTHVFTPAPIPSPVTEATLAASTVVTGQMTIKGTITIDPSVPSSQTIFATAGLFVTDAIFNNSAVGVVPVKRAGKTGTFSLSFAYRMAVASASRAGASHSLRERRVADQSELAADADHLAPARRRDDGRQRAGLAMTAAPSHRLTAAALLAAAALTVYSSPASAETVVRNGTFRVTGSVTLGPNVPASAALTGTATAQLFDSVATFEGASVAAEMTRTGNKAVITLIVRYAWTLDSASVSKAQVFVAFNVSAANAINSSAGTEVEVPLPANGAATPVTIAASL